MIQKEKKLAIEKIIKMGNPLLREQAQPFQLEEITSNQTQELVQSMWDTMEEYGGIGLAAPQIGISKQLAVIRINEDNERYPEAEKSEEIVIFNPQITVLDETLQGFWEGCLSVPGLRGVVFRPRKVQIDYLDESAKEKSIIAEDFLATVFQHELDHLFGKLFIDRIEDISTLSFEDELVSAKEEKEL